MKEAKFERFCVIEPLRNEFSVQLTTSPGIVVGAEFNLYKPDESQPTKSWKMGIQKNETVYKIITDNAKELDKYVLAWQILYCTDKLNIAEGQLELRFSQAGMNCTTNHPVRWNLSNIPPCKVKSYFEINDSIMFLLRKLR